MLVADRPDYHYSSLYNLACFYQRQRRYGEADTLWHNVALRSFTNIR
ncbi:MAG: hypothetical protein RMJ66_08680 [Bacteroidia bacterium]|nr:hypothetical protein [Bacteroidia bacterium]